MKDSPILIINGSPREGGNTDTILEKLIEGAQSTDLNPWYVKLRDLNIANCIACCTCKDEGKCHFNDDMTRMREWIENSRLMIFASPIYWCEITGLMKTFIDRLYFYHHPQNSSLLATKKSLIVTTMGEEENVDYESQVLVEFYRRIFKSLKVTIVDMLFFSGLMGKEDIFRKPEYLEEAFDKGKRLKEML